MITYMQTTILSPLESRAVAIGYSVEDVAQLVEYCASRGIKLVYKKQERQIWYRFNVGGWIKVPVSSLAKFLQSPELLEA